MSYSQAPQPEQTLEWTFQRSFCGTHVVQGIGYVFLHMILTIVFIPLFILLSFLPRPPDVVIIAGLFLFALFVIVIILFGLSGKRASRTLRINRQTISLTDTTVFGTKERRMATKGAKYRAVHFDLFERLFTFGMFRTDSAYHVEVARNGETFLFPCVDETEQRQIIMKIKEFELEN